MGGTRSRRAVSAKKKKVSAALEALKRSRAGLGRGPLPAEDDAAGQIYDVVDDSEYAQRMRETGDDDFVVDEHGDVVDYGMDDDWDTPAKEAPTPTRKRGAGSSARRRTAAAPSSSSSSRKKPRASPSSKGNRDLTAMFGAVAAMSKSKSKARARGKDAKGKGKAAAAADDDDGGLNLDAMMAGVRSAVKSDVRRGARKRVRAPHAAPRHTTPVTPARRSPRKPMRGPSAVARALVKREPMEESAAGPATPTTPTTLTTAKLEPREDEFDISAADEAALLAAGGDAMEVKQEIAAAAAVAKEEPLTPGGSDDDVAGVVTPNAFEKFEAQQREAGPAVSVQESLGSISSAHHVTRFAPPVRPDGSMDMYYFDVYEDQHNAPGHVFLFGKVHVEGKGFVSCCVDVPEMERRVYFLKRTRAVNAAGKETDTVVTDADFKREVMGVMRRRGVHSFGMKLSTKKYAFELRDVPAEAEYMEVVYPDKSRVLFDDEMSGATFSRVFGTHTSCAEHLIIQRKLKGPCWITLQGVVKTQRPFTWCKVECTVKDMDALTPMAPPPGERLPEPPTMSVLSLSVRTVLNRKHLNEVVMASGLFFPAVHIDGPTDKPSANLSYFSAVRKLDGRPWPDGFAATLKRKNKTVMCCNTESDLLDFVLKMLIHYDADVLVGHNITGFTIDVLLHRMKAHKIQQWSKLGRLSRTKMPPLPRSGDQSTWVQRSVTAGRLLCDTYLSARELLYGQRSYSLHELAATQLHAKRQDIDLNNVPQYYRSAASLLHFVGHCENDAYLSALLMFHLMILPLTRELTCLAGNVWGRSLLGARAERNEYLLLHEFHSRGYVVPDKPRRKKVAEGGGGGAGAGDKKGKKKRRKPQYAGGLVLEPKRGLYDKYVLLLDFNSLYPSIICQHDLCFTTVTRPEQNSDGSFPRADLPPRRDGDPRGVLPNVIKTLVERRSAVKKALKEATMKRMEKERQQYDIRQKALKITANSMYGCLGFANSRFYARPIAELITATGRDLLQATVDKVQKLNMAVVYGDTDSVMVNSGETDYEAARAKAMQVKGAVNEKGSFLEIDLDGMYRPMLLLRKKKYAALMVSKDKSGNLVSKREAKGLDLVRRDWSVLSREIGNLVLNEILNCSREQDDVVERIHTHLRGLCEAIDQRTVPLAKYIITKSLTRAPEDYADPKSQPHVMVALAMRKNGTFVGRGQVVEYIVCKATAPGQSIAERAHAPGEVAKSDALEPDYEWYKATQLHPPVARLCDPIDGTDAAQLADCLGLDPSKFHSMSLDKDDLGNAVSVTLADNAQKFAECTPFTYRCSRDGCDGVTPFDGVVGALQDAAKSSDLFKCSACHHRVSGGALLNQLTLTMNTHIETYYDGEMMDGDACMRTMPLAVAADKELHEVYTSGKLRTQLQYFKSLVDVAGARELLAREETRRKRPAGSLVMGAFRVSDEELLLRLKTLVNAQLARSEAHRFNLRSVLSECGLPV